MSFINTITTFVKLIPSIIGAVRALEKAIPIAKAGAAKLGILKQIVLTAWKAAQRDDGKLSVEEFLDGVTAIINELVALFNEKGWPELPE